MLVYLSQEGLRTMLTGQREQLCQVLDLMERGKMRFRSGKADTTPEQMDNLRAIIANIDKTLERFTDA